MGERLLYSLDAPEDVLRFVQTVKNELLTQKEAL